MTWIAIFHSSCVDSTMENFMKIKKQKKFTRDLSESSENLFFERKSIWVWFENWIMNYDNFIHFLIVVLRKVYVFTVWSQVSNSFYIRSNESENICGIVYITVLYFLKILSECTLYVQVEKNF